MNDQIKYLAMKSGLHFDGYGYPIWGCLAGEDEKKEFLEKFAMSIVQECLSQVEEQYKLISQDQTMMKDKHWVGYVDCGVDSVVGIREHFGVEE
jgi:hypothetical protein